MGFACLYVIAVTVSGRSSWTLSLAAKTRAASQATNGCGLLVVRGVAAVWAASLRHSEEEIVRRILVLSAVLLMVLAAGPAAWADNIAAAGDISQKVGGTRNDQATARLLAPSSGNGIGLVLALGDTQYECGEMENYLGAYNLSWGQFKGITRPVPGHHEYLTSSPQGCLGQAPGPMRMLQPAGADYYQYFAGGRHPTLATTRSTPRRGTSWSSTRPVRSCRVGARGRCWTG
jgi:hypothetical protein